MRISAIISVMLLAAAMARPAAAQDPVADCAITTVAFPPDVVIAGCTAVITSGRWSGKGVVWAYHNRGHAYAAKGLGDAEGDYDRAIADFTEVIRLEPDGAYGYEAYRNRAEVYALKGDFDRAIIDYAEAIRMRPKEVIPFIFRGRAYAAKGDYDRAIADDTEAIRLDPQYDLAYFDRGIATFYSGAPAKALADLDQAISLAVGDPYTALWRDIVGRRSGQPSRLAETAAHTDMTKWPAPVIRLFLGRLTAKAVLAAAEDPQPTIKKRRVCDASFYGGELDLRQANKDAATALFRSAAASCEKNSTEYIATVAELKARGISP